MTVVLATISILLLCDLSVLINIILRKSVILVLLNICKKVPSHLGRLKANWTFRLVAKKLLQIFQFFKTPNYCMFHSHTTVTSSIIIDDDQMGNIFLLVIIS